MLLQAGRARARVALEDACAFRCTALAGTPPLAGGADGESEWGDWAMCPVVGARHRVGGRDQRRTSGHGVGPIGAWDAFAGAVEACVVVCGVTGVVSGGASGGAGRGAAEVVGGGVAGLVRGGMACGMGSSLPLFAWGIFTSAALGGGVAAGCALDCPALAESSKDSNQERERARPPTGSRTTYVSPRDERLRLRSWDRRRRVVKGRTRIRQRRRKKMRRGMLCGRCALDPGSTSVYCADT